MERYGEVLAALDLFGGQIFSAQAWFVYMQESAAVLHTALPA